MSQVELAQRAVADDKEDKEDMMDIPTNEVEEASLVQVDVNDLVTELVGWRETLADMLEQMPREAFERLFLRLLGEDGMSDIELSGANDVIDGIGTVGGGGFFSFRVSFKCIRGAGRISSGEIDDFRREVMVGRADRGSADHDWQVHAGSGIESRQRSRAGDQADRWRGVH